MVLQETYNYKDIEFKKKIGIQCDYINNDFITEEMILFPLYKKIRIDKRTKTYNFFPCNDIRVECYCKECNSRRIFSFSNSELAMVSLLTDCTPGSLTSDSIPHDCLESSLKEIDFFTFNAIADCQHKMIIHFMKVNDETIMKVGQFPSIYDLDESINNKKFLKILGKEYSEYYKSACSLYSFNTCIGALTYLRRIFEKLLIDVFNDNKKSLSIDYEEYQKMRMEDKIKTIKTYLPDIMQEQGFNKIYTNISDGIHNLSEEDCSVIFPVLKEGIEEILIERLERIEKEKRRKELSSKLNDI